MNQLLIYAIIRVNFITIMLNEVYTQEDILHDIYVKFWDREN